MLLLAEQEGRDIEMKGSDTVLTLAKRAPSSGEDRPICINYKRTLQMIREVCTKRGRGQKQHRWRLQRRGGMGWIYQDKGESRGRVPR